MALLKNTGTTPSGEEISIPISGRSKGTQIPLGANATWSSGWIQVDNYIGVATTLFSDVAGSYLLEYSEDGNAVGQMPSITIQYNQLNQTRKGSFSPSAKWVKFTYTNGATAQTKFIFNIDLNDTQTQASSETLNATGADTRMATWSKTRIETKTSDGTNDYAPIYRTGNALRVSVDNQQSVSTSSATVSTVTTTSTASIVLPANPNRRGASFFSVSGTILIKLGTGASATSFTARIVTNSMYELPYPTYTGVITAIGVGTLNVTEAVA